MKDVTLSFNGLALSEPCAVCKGEGETPPLPKPLCPGCNREITPIETPEEDAITYEDSSRWLCRNPLKCPECGQHGSGQDFGTEPIWCGECEGTGRALTAAGRELLAFIDTYRGGGNSR